MFLAKIRYVILFIACGFFLLCDQFLKWQTTHAWAEPHLLDRYFGWFPFQNPGVAFSIPLPNSFIVAITFPILFIFIFLLYKELARQKATGENRLLSTVALSAIVTGALSNFIDRIRFHHTVDYLLIGTGVINVADVLIVVGFVIYFWSVRRKSHI